MNSAHTPATFEGETTINKQSEIARELLEKAVGSTPSMGQNVEVKAALTSLQDLVTRQGQYTNTLASTSNPFFNRVLVDIDPAKLERPPWDVVLEVIEMASSTSSFHGTSATLTGASLPDHVLCRHISVSEYEEHA